MAVKPEFIQLFEKATGIPLKQVPFEEINKKENWGYLTGKRAYSVDDNNNLIGLSLDYIPQFLWNVLPWKNLEALDYLSIKSCTIFNISFLKDLKGLTSLDLINNNIQDISF